MKLAEALLLRADLQRKLASLQARAQKDVIVQEGERPAEDPTAVLGQVEAVAGELCVTGWRSARYTVPCLLAGLTAYWVNGSCLIVLIAPAC